MSFGNAVRQREEMISEYESMLKNTTLQSRIDDINHQISFLKDEISELKKGKPLFGRPKPLQQTRTIIEPDRESPSGQKVTVINPINDSTSTVAPSIPVAPSKTTNGRLENSLRAKIQAAKAAKKTA